MNQPDKDNDGKVTIKNEFTSPGKVFSALVCLIAGAGGGTWIAGTSLDQQQIADCDIYEQRASYTKQELELERQYTRITEDKVDQWEEWYARHGREALADLNSVRSMAASAELPRYYRERVPMETRGIVK